MQHLHIVQGGIENGDKGRLERASGTRTWMRSWIVPKSVRRGDDVIIHVGKFGLFATAVIASPPIKRSDWRNRYGAAIEKIRLIEPPVSLAAVKRFVPDVTWARYPRSITTPSRKVAVKLLLLIERRRKQKCPEAIDRQFIQEANLDELRAIALLRSRTRLLGQSSKAVQYARSEAIRLYVLTRAKGKCEGCGKPAPFVNREGRPYIEPHHVTRVADGGPDHPSRVIGLCPNCHQRAHHSIDRKEFNRKLRARLVRLDHPWRKSG